MATTDESHKSDTTSKSSAILFNSVSKIYNSGESAVTASDDLNFEIKKGQFVSVVGPSGCGKSTLLHMASSLIPQTSGRIYINGTGVQDTTYNKHEAGLVFQEPVLLDWRTVRQNILLPIRILKDNGHLEEEESYYEKRTEELLESVGLSEFADSYPPELSGGMQQRVAICRSLIYDPSVLLMDEPFGALDAFTRNKLNNMLLDIWQQTNKTILFITHNLEEAVFLSDRIIILSPRPGSIVTKIEVDLPRPRTENTRTTDRFQELNTEAYSYFKDLFFEGE
jgi:NitT/TauT family transport system ATP-binding protein